MEQLGDKLYNKIDHTVQTLRSYLESQPSSPDVSALKSLRTFCENRMYSTSDPTEAMTCFFLKSYIRQIAIDFGGDVPYSHDLSSNKVHLFRVICDNLNTLSIALKHENPTQVSDTLGNLTSAYTKSINSLNSIDI